MRVLLNRVLPPLLPIVIVTTVFEGLIRGGVVPAYLVPMPSEVFHSLLADRDELFNAAVLTAEAALSGLGLSFFSGVSLAILLSLSDFVRRALYPYAVFFQTVPIISVAPLLVIWFGYGLPTVIASAFIVSVFPVIASTLLGLQSVDPALLDLFRLYSAKHRMVLFKLRLPFALPQIFAGLRIASGLAVIGAIVGEFIAGGGLGGVVDAARTLQRIDKVFAAVLVSSALGLLLVVLIDVVSRLSLRHWHASERSQ